MGQILHGSARTTAAAYFWSGALEKAFKHYPPGYFHMTIDRTSKLAYTDRATRPAARAVTRAEPHPSTTKLIAAQFLRNLIEAMPYQRHTVLTDNGIQFTNRKKYRHALIYIFDRVCFQHGVEYRLTKPNHPWTNGQVERMNRTFKDTTVRCYPYKPYQHLEEHLHASLMSYNFAKRLKTLRGLTPYEFVRASWQKELDRSRPTPPHLGMNI